MSRDESRRVVYTALRDSAKNDRDRAFFERKLRELRACTDGDILPDEPSALTFDGTDEQALDRGTWPDEGVK